MQDWWRDTAILSIPIWNWMLMLAATSVMLAALLWARGLLRRRLDRRASDAHASPAFLFLQVVASTNVLALFALSVLVCVKLLELPAGWSIAVARLWFIAAVIQVAAWLNTATGFMLQRYRDRHPTTNLVTLTLIGYALRTVLWTVAGLAILDNLGVNITAFVASLGIGGIAVALAAQVVLGDLFASAAIGLDKPFEVGDFVVVGNVAGTIEYVGLKTTRIRSLGGEQVVCSNTELLKQTIQNYKRMALRRVAFRFVVAYGATEQQVESITQAVRAHIESLELARFDRAHLLQFVERGLEFEVVYYVLSADYNVYMDMQQGINLAIMRAVHGQALEFGRGEMRVHRAGRIDPVADVSAGEALNNPRDGSQSVSGS